MVIAHHQPSSPLGSVTASCLRLTDDGAKLLPLHPAPRCELHFLLRVQYPTRSTDKRTLKPYKNRPDCILPISCLYNLGCRCHCRWSCCRASTVVSVGLQQPFFPQSLHDRIPDEFGTVGEWSQDCVNIHWVHHADWLLVVFSTYSQRFKSRSMVCSVFHYFGF